MAKFGFEIRWWVGRRHEVTNPYDITVYIIVEDYRVYYNIIYMNIILKQNALNCH